MNKDWGKAIAQLCVIAQNNTDLKEPVLQYVEFMKTIYGIDGADFLDIYREWERSGEIVDKREKVSCTGLENIEKNLYPQSMDGLCRLYDEGILEEDAFCETLFEEDYEIKNVVFIKAVRPAVNPNFSTVALKPLNATDNFTFTYNSAKSQVITLDVRDFENAIEGRDVVSYNNTVYSTFVQLYIPEYDTANKLVGYTTSLVNVSIPSGMYEIKM